LFTVIGGIPSVYREQDDLAGAGTLRALLEGLVPSLDGLRQRIRDYDQLRDPLLAPIDTDFDVNVIVIRTDDQGDGTSIVFLSEGPDGDKFIGIRPGMVLIDLIGNRFTIDSVHSSALPIDVDNPPTDPATIATTGRHIIVSNIGQASTELIPFASSTLITNENPAPAGAVGSIVAIAQALLVDTETFTLNDGAHPAVIFEFDTVPDGVVPGRIQVDVSLAVSAVDVANAMVEAINTAPNLNMVAANNLGASATVTITNFGAGMAGNIVIADTVANVGFVVTGMAGGAAGAFPLDPLGFDDGVSLAPYVFNRAGAVPPPGSVIAPNRVEITWTESGIQKNGFFTAAGLPGGDLADTSTLSRGTTAPILAAGQFKLYNDSGAVIDADSIQVTYTLTPAVQTEDAEIRAQNILAFLAGDYGIKLDRNDPEFLQRSYVNNAFKIWDIKGTELGYDVLGQYAGYFVSAQPLYAISATVAAGLDPSLVYELPEGDPAIGFIVAIAAAFLIEGETFVLDDGVNPPTTFEFDTDTIVVGANVPVDISVATTVLDVANAIVVAVNLTIGLDLTAGNGGSTLTTVTIANAENGTQGNVTTWVDTVADAGFAITQPTGGVDSDLFTTINPGRALFDDVALDSIPLDLLCSDETYPHTVQVVTVTSSVKIRDEGSNKRSLVTVTTATMYNSFGTDGTFTDFNGAVFDIDGFTRVNATTYTFEVVDFLLPVIGRGTVSWSVFAFESVQAFGTLTLVGVPLNGETVTLGSKAYTFQTVLTNVDGNVAIGGSTNVAIANLYAAVTLGAGAGTAYAAATTAHPTVFADAPVALAMRVFALTAGPVGNSISTVETLTNGSFGSATLINGSTQTPISITGIGVDVIDLGVQYNGYTGHRYRITKAFVDPPLAGVGNWAFIDSAGVISYIETFEETSTPGTYVFEIVSSTVPASGTANIFYFCEIVTACDFCRASSILVKISPSAILGFPESLAGDVLGRLIIRLEQMIPAHVRIATFIYDPGPAIAAWGSIAASSMIEEYWSDDGLYTAVYDEDEYPADELPTDGAPITASSEVTITNQNVLEEYLVGPDPLIAATWTGTGLWQTTEYNSSTSFRSFNYGDEDVGTVTPPNYDIGAFVTSGTLTSPTVNIPAATTVLLKFRHYGDMLAGGADDVVSVLVVDEAPLSTVQTITKTDLGLFATGTNGGFTSFSVPISPAVIGIGNFHLEFVFNSVSLTTGRGALQGWYVDDVEIQVIP
jgi:hypothetical protein